METPHTPSETDHPVLSALDDLYRRVSAQSMQPLNLLTEDAVLHWTRVVDGQDVVQPRLGEQGIALTVFYLGTEIRPGRAMDPCGLPNGPEAFQPECEARLAGLAGLLEDYFGGGGYRGSSDQCDRVMLELARLSRFFNAWAALAQQRHKTRWGNRASEGQVNVYLDDGQDDFLVLAVRMLAVWEPFFNSAIVSWEENHLEPFDRALRELRELLARPAAARWESLPPPGYPLRPRGRPRQKISVFDPDQRPLRSRSVLQVRYQQLRERLLGGPSLSRGLLSDLAEDVVHFSRMVETNLFMLASRPGFFERGRPGVPIIRGRPIHHPFFLDRAGLFKKAVLFHNRTYSAFGGGLDEMFLQMRQLERLCKFMRWGEWARPLRTPVDRAILAWEENRWEGFTEGLLEVAGLLREEE